MFGIAFFHIETMSFGVPGIERHAGSKTSATRCDFECFFWLMIHMMFSSTL